MCFSERVSWLTLASAWSGCLALAAAGEPHLQALAGFLAWVAAMQMVEAMLWRHPGCSETNGLVSGAGAVINHAEPLVLFVLARCMLRPRSPAAARAALVLVAASTAVFGALTVQYLRRPLEDRCTRRTPDGLVWQWNDLGSGTKLYVLFVAALVATLYAYLPDPWFMIGAVLLTFGASHAMYRNRKMVGSMWCFFAAFLPWVLVAKTC